MSTNFVVSAKSNVSRFQLNVSKGDAEPCEVDFRPWQDDNDTITAVTWTLESGQAAISSEVLTSGLATALLTFSQAGRSMISILATTATAKKKVWLEVLAKDQDIVTDDYGVCNG